MKNKDKKPPSSGKNNFAMPKKIGIIYSEVKRKYFPTEMQYLTEKDALRDAKIIAAYFKKLKIKTLLYPASASLAEKLRRQKPEMVLNLVGSVRGQEYLSSTVPALLELLNIPYTGASILGESLVYNKFLVKKLLEQNGIPVPKHQLFNSHNDYLDPTLRFPLISKLNEIHGAVEITKEAVSEDEKHLRQRVKFLINTYKQPVLIEEFIVGREITAMVLEGVNKKVYLAEKVFNMPGEKYLFANFDLQWTDDDGEKMRYQKYDDPVLREYVKKAFDIVGMFDYGKFDVRLDASGRYYFVDSNTNPAFGPKETETAISLILDLYGISFLEILKRLVANTMRDALGKERLPMPGNGDA